MSNTEPNEMSCVNCGHIGQPEYWHFTAEHTGLYVLVVDGQLWQDADGISAFPARDLDALVEHLQRQGYETIDNWRIA
jgi:hypothetical protein